MAVKTLFLITVTTARIFMPGMPAMPKLPGMKIPDMSAPTRTLQFDLTSDNKVNAESKAQVAIPEGLLLGPKLDLTIDLPAPSEGSTGGPGQDQKPGEKAKFVMKTYWQCAEVVPQGQPKILDMDKMMSGAGGTIPKEAQQFQKNYRRMAANADKSHAYWPGKDNRKIEKSATTPGGYNLTTNYTGGTSIDLNQGQDFLAPVEFVGLTPDIDLDKTIQLEWKAIPNATAYLLTAFAGKEGLMVIWTSSADPNVMDIQGRAITTEEMQKLLANGVVLPPTKTTCRIPAGIFKEVGNPMITVTAFGTDRIQTKDGIETQVVVRSNATAMLGKGMAGMQGQEDNPPTDNSSDKSATSGDDGASKAADEVADTVKDAAKESKDEAANDAKSSLKNTIKNKLRRWGH